MQAWRGMMLLLATAISGTSSINLALKNLEGLIALQEQLSEVLVE